MAFFASYLRHTLSLLDIRAEIVASTGGESLKRLGRIDEDTLLIALSAGRAHPLLLRAMKLAMHRRSEEHTSELQSRQYLVCRLLLEKKTHCADSVCTGGVLWD